MWIQAEFLSDGISPRDSDQQVLQFGPAVTIQQEVGNCSCRGEKVQVVMLKLPQGGAQSRLSDAGLEKLRQNPGLPQSQSCFVVAEDVDRPTVFSSNRRFAGLYRVT